MPKPELGVRRRCLTCGAAFFDLNRSPILCVKCGAVFNIVELPRSPARRAPVRMNAAESLVPAAPADGDAALVDDEDSEDSAGEESTLPPPDEDDEDDSLEGIVVIENDEKAADV